MDVLPRNPLLYQVNTRVLMRSLADELRRPATLDDVPDEALEAVRALGFDWIWFLGVWQTGEAARQISLSHADWQAGFREAVPDMKPADVCGSPFAVQDYIVDRRLGGDAALARLRERAARAGLRLMLDFVPNHVAPDHPWVRAWPDLFIRGTEADLAAEPANWIRLPSGIFANGRDPYFPGWPDTVQLDYANPKTQAIMASTLRDVARRCDGLRCDMAMLLLPDVFERTWERQLDGRRVGLFWPDAIAAVRTHDPDFCFMAEVYWGLEGRLIDQGFDLAYDKALYDAARDGDAGRVRSLLAADPGAQHHLARFLENHDEARAAAAFDWPRHRAAALAVLAAPGLRLLHQGQLEGLRVHVPIHLDRGPVESVDPVVLAFYQQLLAALRLPALRDGAYRWLWPQAAWDGNPTHERFVTALWQHEDGERLLLAVNFSAGQAQCRVRLDLAAGKVVLEDRMGPERYERDGGEIGRDGLFLDLPPWGFNLFAIG